MNIGVPPLNKMLPVAGQLASWPQPWAQWFTALMLSVFGWRKSYTGTLAKTWGLIAGAAEDSATATITGARSGDAVLVQPATRTVGIVDNIGVVTADDVVTVYAVNATAAGITPGAKTYRIICFQQ